MEFRKEMEVFLNRIDGIDDAITAMMMSKRHIDREMEHDIRELVSHVTKRTGSCFPAFPEGLKRDIKDCKEFENNLKMVLKWGRKHITLLKFIDLSVTVYGLHRAGQDDWDSHAKRFDNRIVRQSTRLADFKEGEISEWYSNKIIPTDIALAILGIETPDKLEHNGVTYVRGVNGYIRDGFEENKDAKRGLYMLSIPSSFIFRINLAEWAHVYRMRNELSSANPEVKKMCESIQNQVERFQPLITRDFLMEVEN